MWTLPSTPDVLLAFGTVLAGAAAMWGAFSAHSGLSTWRSQQVWMRDADLAKSLLVTLFKRKDALQQVRSPLGYMSLEALSDREKKWEEIRSDYRNRLRELSDARADFYSLQHEAYAVWNAEILEFVEPIRKLEIELFVEIEEYLESLNPIHNPMEYFGSKEEMLRNKNIVLARGAKRDSFGPRYEACTLELERFLRDRLGR